MEPVRLLPAQESTESDQSQEPVDVHHSLLISTNNQPQSVLMPPTGHLINQESSTDVEPLPTTPSLPSVMTLLKTISSRTLGEPHGDKVDI